MTECNYCGGEHDRQFCPGCGAIRQRSQKKAKKGRFRNLLDLLKLNLGPTAKTRILKEALNSSPLLGQLHIRERCFIDIGSIENYRQLTIDRITQEIERELEIQRGLLYDEHPKLAQ